MFTLSGVDSLVELTAGCVALIVAEELRVPIKSPIREVLSERAAGCSAPLGTDGLVVSIVLPIREIMLWLIRLLMLVVDRFVITFRVLLPDVFLVSMELPMRDVMLGLMLREESL